VGPVEEAEEDMDGDGGSQAQGDGPPQRDCSSNSSANQTLPGQGLGKSAEHPNGVSWPL
jgi:hypothetical protein